MSLSLIFSLDVSELLAINFLVLVEGVRLELGLEFPGLVGGNERSEVFLCDDLVVLSTLQ